jgi:hypothetical protein
MTAHEGRPLSSGIMRPRHRPGGYDEPESRYAAGWISEGPEQSRLRKLRPYERSRCVEHGVSYRGVAWSVPAPPGIVMVAPLEIPRNAQPGNVRAALNSQGQRTKKRGQGQYKGRSP